PLYLGYDRYSGQVGELPNDGGGSVLLAAATDPMDPGRLIIGIHKAGGLGLQGEQGRDRILAFQIKSQTAASFAAQMPRIEHFRASDSSNMTIQGIAPVDQLVLSLQ